MFSEILMVVFEYFSVGVIFSQRKSLKVEDQSGRGATVFQSQVEVDNCSENKMPN
jgi:hypothetical protein